MALGFEGFDPSINSTLKRPLVCSSSVGQQWLDEMFQKFCKQLQKFKNLHDIQMSCYRLFNFNQLKKLYLVSSSMCEITIKG
uniref:Uncharacterized protein n=1 Tax=Glossina pallidipes TaxID=7398 RepID=A0A1A9Z2E1_GLOPL